MPSAADEGAAFKLKEPTEQKNGKRLWKLIFDLPGEKVNKLSRKVIEEFDLLLFQLEDLGQRKQIDALVLFSGKPRNFIAGADIELIQSAKDSKEAEQLSRVGQQLLDRWEDLPFPTVAAVEGPALGGGCEFCLASSAIVMSNDSAAKIGLPEVMLGLIPGMGGCVRLPRKIGLATSLDLILTGKSLSAERAFKIGLVEACLPREDFQEAVLRWIVTNLDALRFRRRIARKPKLGGFGGPLGALMEGSWVGRNLILKKAKEGVEAKTKGYYPAPLEAISVIQETAGGYAGRLLGRERDSAMQREARGFGRVAVTDVSRNLIRIFFLTEDIKKSRGLPSTNIEQARAVSQGAVLGAGVMGGGIAQLFAEKNVSVRMKDLNFQALTLGIHAASRAFQRQAQKRRITTRQALQKLNMIAPVVDFTGFGSVDLVVEAIVENMEVKQRVLAELEEKVSDRSIIASNTSSLSISKMQSVLKKPERFLGMHFFNPVGRMPLIEVIRGEKTSDEAITTVFQFSKQLGKTPIVVKDSPGFLVNRLLMPYLNEATWLIADGGDILTIDRVLSEFGMPMGPLELIDEIGVDVGEKVAHILYKAFGSRMEPSPINGKVVDSGRFGKKSGKGLYEYSRSKKGPELNPDIYKILGTKPDSDRFTSEEILDRCILPMINEAARCLEEKVVASASEIDLGMIMGAGFPPFRGGLLRYADLVGIDEVMKRLRKYEKRFGNRFEPATALVTRAKNGQSFYES